MSSFIAAGTAYATHGVNTIPFFIYYSMFGFQRIGDLIWAAADSRCRGFLLGGTAGRTTLTGEGLQHQDGHSHVLSLTVPTCMSYDPAFAYEIAVIIQDGIRRMYGNGESVFYYLTVMNENYEMPAMPEGDDVREGILKGLYRFAPTSKPKAKLPGAAAGQRRHPARGDQGAGDPRREVRRRAPTCGASRATTSCVATAMRPTAGTCCIPARRREVPYVTEQLAEAPRASIIAASDYMKVLPDTLEPLGAAAASCRSAPTASAEARAAPTCATTSRWTPVRHGRDTARRWRSDGQIEAKVVQKAIKDLGIDPEKKNPAIA